MSTSAQDFPNEQPDEFGAFVADDSDMFAPYRDQARSGGVYDEPGRGEVDRTTDDSGESDGIEPERGRVADDSRHLRAVPDPRTGAKPSISDEAFLGVAANAERWSIPRHPEDPDDAYQSAVCEAALLDPDTMRTNGVDVGTTSQAMQRETFYTLQLRLYGGMVAIRKGALRSEAIGQAEESLATVRSTETDCAKITADGQADEQLLAQHQRWLQEQERELGRREEQLEAAEQRREDLEDEWINNPERWAQAEQEDPRSIGTAFEWLSTGKRPTVAVMGTEVALSGLLLSAPIEQIVSVEVPFSGFLLGVGVSIVLFFVGWYAGRALAAVKLPVRLVAALFVLVGAALAWRAMGSIDAIRIGDGIEGRKFFTVSTLSNVYIATLVSYMSSVHSVFARQRNRLESLPTKVDLMAEKRQRVADQVSAATEACTAARAVVAETKARIAELVESVASVNSRVEARRALGKQASVAVDAILARLRVHLTQENANGAAAVAASSFAYEKAIIETYPASGQVVAATDGPSMPSTPIQKRKPWAALVAAIICVLGIVLGIVAAALGHLVGLAASLVCALALAALALARSRRKPRPEVAGAEEVRSSGPATIKPAINAEAPLWHELPQHTRTKHGRGATEPTNRA